MQLRLYSEVPLVHKELQRFVVVIEFACTIVHARVLLHDEWVAMLAAYTNIYSCSVHNYFCDQHCQENFVMLWWTWCAHQQTLKRRVGVALLLLNIDISHSPPTWLACCATTICKIVTKYGIVNGLPSHIMHFHRGMSFGILVPYYFEYALEVLIAGRWVFGHLTTLWSLQVGLIKILWIR